MKGVIYVSTLFVCLMGVGTVFSGLICIILLVKIMGALCSAFVKAPSEVKKPAVAQNDDQIPNKQEIVAGVCAAIAEELGEDVNNIKVVSFKKA